MPEFVLQTPGADPTATLRPLFARASEIRIREDDTGSWGGPLQDTEALSIFRQRAVTNSSACFPLDRLEAGTISIPATVAEASRGVVSVYWLEERDWDAQRLAAFVDLMGALRAATPGGSIRFPHPPHDAQVEAAIDDFLGDGAHSRSNPPG